MAADLSIHVFEGVTEEDLAAFFSHTLGSKYMDLNRRTDLGVHLKISDTPGIWIGEVSWLKAAITGDMEYVPGPVQSVQETIGEDLPEVDDALIARIMAAFDIPNLTAYHIAEPAEVRSFLEAHRGKRLFTVSW